MREKAPGDEAGRAAAARMALAEVRAGMKLGLGSGRTAEQFVRFLGDKVKAGLSVVGVPTSERTAALAGDVGVPLTTLDETPLASAPRIVAAVCAVVLLLLSLFAQVAISAAQEAIASWFPWLDAWTVVGGASFGG